MESWTSATSRSAELNSSSGPMFAKDRRHVGSDDTLRMARVLHREGEPAPDVRVGHHGALEVTLGGEAGDGHRTSQPSMIQVVM